MGKKHSNVSTMSKALPATPRHNIILHSNYYKGISVIGFSNFLEPDATATSFVNLDVELQLPSLCKYKDGFCIYLFI